MRSSPVAVVGLVVAGFACGGGDPVVVDAPVVVDGRVDAPGPDAREDGLGSVDNIPGSCANGSLPRTRCQLLQVDCPGVDLRQVEIRISDPPDGTARRGTIVLGTGAGGGTYYEADPVARIMMNELSAAGFRLVQRQWIGADGWLGGPGGVRALACRYASLLQYIHDEIHQESPTEALCATGNSGGAAEIAYALAAWGRAPILELAVPTGGPPMGRLDHGCLDGDDAAWQAECAALVGTSSTCAPVACGYAPGAQALIDSAYTADNCAAATESFRPTFLADSAAAPGNAFDYPTTPVRFLFGADDCTEAVPLGLAFAEQVTSDKQIDFIAGTAHPVFATTAGANAIRDALLTGCVVPD